MKHSDFYTKVSELKAKEQEKLKEAVMLRGGSYEWGEEEEKPIVAVNIGGCCPHPADIEISKVSIGKYGEVILCGTEKEVCESPDFTPDDVFAGHLSHIIDYIPEINGTGDSCGGY